jgi:hypothetical protein
MGKTKSSSKSKEVLVDEEATLSIIENQDFVAKRASEKIWPSQSMTKEQPRELVGDDLIQEQGFTNWKTPGQHRVPTLYPGEIVLFVSFIRAGLCLLASSFLHRFLQYFGVCLNHLTPNGVLHLLVFVHLCETFLGIPPSIFLFCNISSLGGCGIQFRQGKKNLFFNYDLVDSVKEWRSEWFYARNMLPALSFRTDSGPLINDRWEKNPLLIEELMKI